MNTQKMKLVIGVLLISLFIPQASEAYTSDDKIASKIDSDTALYTVSYKFGFGNRALYVPIVTGRGLNASSTKFQVGYDILNHGTASKIGSVESVILTDDPDVEIRNGQYYLPEGKAAVFTLVAIQTLSDTEIVTNPNLSLQVTNLPFTMVNKNVKSGYHFNPPQLAPYHTPAVSF